MLCLRILWTTGVNTSMTTMDRGRSLQCWGDRRTWLALSLGPSPREHGAWVPCRTVWPGSVFIFLEEEKWVRKGVYVCFLF